MHHKSKSDLGICFHALGSLLSNSTHYSYAFVKEQRDHWHPDRFSRLGAPAQKERLTKKAEQLFVLMSALIDHLKNEARA